MKTVQSRVVYYNGSRWSVHRDPGLARPILVAVWHGSTFQLFRRPEYNYYFSPNFYSTMYGHYA